MRGSHDNLDLATMPRMAKEQRIIFFEGDVQGVGFRYTATHLANGFMVTGYVRNLPDGRVEMLVEGDADEITAFVKEVASRFTEYIREQSIFRHEFTGKFDGFTVRR